jgi:hypothetical protein
MQEKTVQIGKSTQCASVRYKSMLLLERTPMTILGYFTIPQIKHTLCRHKQSQCTGFQSLWIIAQLEEALHETRNKYKILENVCVEFVE